jgi:hypothetical protein
VHSLATRADHRSGSAEELRAKIAAAYDLTYGRTARFDTLNALVVIQRWLDERWTEDIELRTTVPEAARAIGWPVIGVGHRDGRRFRNSLTRRLDMLLEMGWIDSWEPVYDERGSGEGILVRARRDSSVGRALLRNADQRELGSILESPPSLALAARFHSLASVQCQGVASVRGSRVSGGRE